MAISNFNHSVTPGAEERLKANKITLAYTAANFYGDVWWNEALGAFLCLVRVHQIPVALLAGRTLDRIRVGASTMFGWE